MAVVLIWSELEEVVEGSDSVVSSEMVPSSVAQRGRGQPGRSHGPDRRGREGNRSVAPNASQASRAGWPITVMSAIDIAPGPRRWTDAGAGLAWVADRGVYLGLMLLVAFNLVFTPRFAEIDNIRLQFVQVVPVAIIALGMALVIGTKGIDLSVGSVMAIASALLAVALGYGPLVAISIAIVGGAAVGLVNGVLIAYFGIQPIVATLALLVGGRGLALVIAQGRLTEIFDPTLGVIGTQRVFGIPIVVLIALALALIVAILVARTTFGRYVVAIGGNPDASSWPACPFGGPCCPSTCFAPSWRRSPESSRRHGQRVRSVIRRESHRTERDHGRRRGGTPLSGGRVRIVGTLAGALLMQLIAATLITHNLPDRQRAWSRR